MYTIKDTKYITGTEITGIHRAIKSSGLPMRQGVEYGCSSGADFIRAAFLGTKPRGSGEDCFLKGIKVDFYWETPVAFQPHILRYHFLDIVSSQSAMHKIKKMKSSKVYHPFVAKQTIALVQLLVDQHEIAKKEKAERTYNVLPLNAFLNRKELYEAIILNSPQGMMKIADYTTNYLQLKTMFLQRLSEPVGMWEDFCQWCLSLPYFIEICLGNKTDWSKIRSIEKGIK